MNRHSSLKSFITLTYLFLKELMLTLSVLNAYYA